MTAVKSFITAANLCSLLLIDYTLAIFIHWTMNSGTLLHNVAFSTTSGEITREALAAGCKYFDLTDSGKALAEVCLFDIEI